MSLKVPMMMKRSTAIDSKQALMSDHSSFSSHFPSPVLFTSFSDAETSEMSPTSILDVKSFSAANHHPWDLSNSKTVGLGILDDLIDEKTVRKPVIEFGVKNKSSKLAMASLLSPSRSSQEPPPPPPPPPPILCLSASEMEKSEDYTRVVSHGPNPRTTHIFDTWIMENCENGFSSLMKEIRISMNGESGNSSNDFLAFCNACKKKLGEGDNTFMFRREAVFMLLEDPMDSSSHCESL